jgi:hypothetical protein
MTEIPGLFDHLQVCIVVPDLETAMEHYRNALGIDSFTVYTVDTRDLPGVTYRGQPADYRVTVALAQIGPWRIELLQNERGESIYTEFVEQHTAGVHHLGFFVEPPQRYPAACAALIEKGFAHIQGGPILGDSRNGRFDYFDSRATLGLFIELLDLPDMPASWAT